MNELLEMYQELGISPAVYHRGEEPYMLPKDDRTWLTQAIDDTASDVSRFARLMVDGGGDSAQAAGPQGRVRAADSSRGRGAERPRAAVARSALRAQPGQAAQGGGFLGGLLVPFRPSEKEPVARGGTRKSFLPLGKRQFPS